jgi:hypothetical protein
VIPIVIATKPDGSAFGNLFFASEAPRKGVSSVSPDNVLAAEVNACCNAEQASAERALYQRLTQSLDEYGRAKLDAMLLPREDLRTVVLTWLRQPPGEPKARNVLPISIGCIVFAK